MFKSGDEVPGRDYVVERLLGQGGYGEVWSARHIYNQHDVRAFKFCWNDGEDGFRRIAALRNEMKLVNRLYAAASADEPHTRGQVNIVRLLETGLSSTPPFIAYEYVDGGDLVAWRASFGESRPPAAQVAKVLRMIARALAFAHGRGVIHRDLKPANVLVTRDGVVKLTDFGIGAQYVRPADPESAETQASVLQGANTPHYADPFREDGPKFDVYAAGVIAYQLLVGDVTRTVAPSLASELESLGTPHWLIQTVLRCLDIPSRRFADGAELIAELRAHAQQNSLHAIPTPEDVAQRNAPNVAASVVSAGRGSLGPIVQETGRSPSKGSRASLTSGQKAALFVGLGAVALVVAIAQSTPTPDPPSPADAGRDTPDDVLSSSSTAEVSVDAPMPEAPPPPVCTPCPGCKHFQIAGGDGVDFFVRRAQAFRAQTSPLCAAVHEVVDKPGYFVFTLGQLAQKEQGEAALAELVASEAWKGAGSPQYVTGAKYGARVYPPKCDGASITSSVPGHTCATLPPIYAQIETDRVSWGEEDVTCSCNVPNGWFSRWNDYAACARTCYGDMTCVAECSQPS